MSSSDSRTLAEGPADHNITGKLRDCFRGRTVIVTGHSGFKGSWLTLWLHSLGANVIGVSLPPESKSLFAEARLSDICKSFWIDIRNAQSLVDLLRANQPDFIFHLAAQALVLPSYSDPLETFSTNILGTANVLEAARKIDSIRAVVCVTTDKVYENTDRHQPFRESDRLGGDDPYSASKSAAELVARSYMTALFRANQPLPLATARGGNVIGGGDWSNERIVPDIVRAVSKGETLVLRNPRATRPWQHVAELCFGYLVLGMRLEMGWPERGQGASSFIGAWNFGPDTSHEISVESLVVKILANLGKPEFPIRNEKANLHEASYLRLDSSKAKTFLGWHPLLSFEETVSWTASWYSDSAKRPDSILALTRKQLTDYEKLIESRLTTRDF